MVLGPGFVANKLYYDVVFPGGHIGVKSVNAELVDRSGAPVPLHQAYLHHWALNRYYAPQNTTHSHHYTLIRNTGICDLGSGLTQCFGVGAETQKTSTRIPHPYGLQVGDPGVVPAGYEEGWVLNVHVIDTRGVEDKMGCVECRCDLYDKQDGEAGLPSGYEGGILCCHDGRRCRVKQGFFGEERSLYLRYTVKYVDWDSSSIVPVKIYILDVTDVWREGDEESKGIKATHHCVVEYEVESCVVGVGVDRNGCLHSKTLSVSFPSGGGVIYGIGHHHSGGTSITLYGEGGRTICSSNPIYGEGSEAGNEAGYIVGMSTCYPSPVGTVKISAGETLTLVSNYSSVERHTGVMGLFYLLLADSPSKPLVSQY